MNTYPNKYYNVTVLDNADIQGIRTSNKEKMLKSDSFGNLSFWDRKECLKLAVDNIKLFTEFLRQNDIRSDEDYKDFIYAVDNSSILEIFFGIQTKDINRFVGEKVPSFVGVSFSNDGSKVIYKYSQNFASKSIDKSVAPELKPKWSLEMRVCRGIIVNIDTLDVVSFPYDKIFNIGEYIDGSSSIVAEKITSEKFIVEEKFDGVMIQVYYDRVNGDLGVSTNKTIDNTKEGESKFIKLAKKFLSTNENYEKIKNYLKNNNVSLICELIHPDARIVVDYGGKIDLILHGMRNLNDYCVTSGSPVLGLSIPRGFVFYSYEELDAFRKDNKENLEGFVIKFDNGFMIKIKTDKYFTRTMGLKKLNYKTIGMAIISGKGWEDFKYDVLKEEELFGIADIYKDRLFKKSEKIKKIVKDFYDWYVSQYDDYRNLAEQSNKYIKELVESGELQLPTDGVYDGFIKVIGSYFKYKKNKTDTQREKLNRKLMEVTILYFVDGWMGEKLNEERELQWEDTPV